MSMITLDFEQDLYKTLGVNKHAKIKELKKAYRRMAMKVHPDRHPKETEKAEKNFVILNKIYEILSNTRKRRLYDTTGEVDLDTNEDFEKEYEKYRSVFKEITKQDIDEFSKVYKGSEEEKEDLIAAYTQCKGNMQKIMEAVPLAEEEDLPGFIEILEKELKKEN
eukprot:UN33157